MVYNHNKGKLEIHRLAREYAKRYTLFSDIFMTVALEDRLACQHVLRVITGMKDLTVKDVKTQKTYTKLAAHSALIDGEMLQKGADYADLPELLMIYISETDIWKTGRPCCRAVRTIEETRQIFEDGLTVMLVNAEVDDGSPIAALMQYFKKADAADTSQGDLSRRVHFLKEEEGGFEVMCKISEMFYEKGQEQGLKQGLQQGLEQGLDQGRRQEKLLIAMNMLKANKPLEEVALFTGLSIEELKSVRW